MFCIEEFKNLGSELWRQGRLGEDGELLFDSIPKILQNFTKTPALKRFFDDRQEPKKEAQQILAANSQ